MRRIRVLAGAGVLAACAESAESPLTPGADYGTLPPSFAFIAEAISGDTISCNLWYLYEVDGETHRSADSAVYQGFFGGEAFRQHLQADGSGEAFWADVAGSFRATLLPGDSFELRVTAPLSDERYRFWDEQLLFAGRRDGQGLPSGTWSCAPLDVRSDTTGIAPGSWWLAVAP